MTQSAHCALAAAPGRPARWVLRLLCKAFIWYAVSAFVFVLLGHAISSTWDSLTHFYWNHGVFASWPYPYRSMPDPVLLDSSLPELVLIFIVQVVLIAVIIALVQVIVFVVVLLLYRIAGWPRYLQTL